MNTSKMRSKYLLMVAMGVGLSAAFLLGSEDGQSAEELKILNQLRKEYAELILRSPDFKGGSLLTASTTAAELRAEIVRLRALGEQRAVRASQQEERALQEPKLPLEIPDISAPAGGQEELEQLIKNVYRLGIATGGAVNMSEEEFRSQVASGKITRGDLIKARNRLEDLMIKDTIVVPGSLTAESVQRILAGRRAASVATQKPVVLSSDDRAELTTLLEEMVRLNGILNRQDWYSKLKQREHFWSQVESGRWTKTDILKKIEDKKSLIEQKKAKDVTTNESVLPKQELPTGVSSAGETGSSLHQPDGGSTVTKGSNDSLHGKPRDDVNANPPTVGAEQPPTDAATLGSSSRQPDGGSTATKGLDDSLHGKPRKEVDAKPLTVGAEQPSTDASTLAKELGKSRSIMNIRLDIDRMEEKIGRLQGWLADVKDQAERADLERDLLQTQAQLKKMQSISSQFDADGNLKQSSFSKLRKNVGKTFESVGGGIRNRIPERWQNRRAAAALGLGALGLAAAGYGAKRWYDARKRAQESVVPLGLLVQVQRDRDHLLQELRSVVANIEGDPTMSSKDVLDRLRATLAPYDSESSY